MPKRPLYLAVILLIISISAFAQKHPCSVWGTVVTANEYPLQYASIFISQNDTVANGTLTYQDGKFELIIPRSKEPYLLTIVFVGYKTKQFEIMADEPTLPLGKIMMEATSQMLDEVNISSQAGEQGHITAAHTTIAPADATVFMGGTVADLLRQQSSVTVDPDGNVSIRGNGNSTLSRTRMPATTRRARAASSTSSPKRTERKASAGWRRSTTVSTTSPTAVLR